MSFQYKSRLDYISFLKSGEYMKYMKYCGFLALVGIMGGLHGCASTIDSLSNNTSSDMIRGVKLKAGVDVESGTPVPNVSFTMGSLARKGKSDRVVVLIDNNATDIVADSYNVYIEYENVGTNTDKPRQLIHREIRTAGSGTSYLSEGIMVHQTSTFGMGVTSGNLFSAGGGTTISMGTIGTYTASMVDKEAVAKATKASQTQNPSEGPSAKETPVKK